MLGFRGCRLGIMYPEITEMQARAIFQAAVAVQKRGIKVHPGVMIPLVSDVTELKAQGAWSSVAAQVVFGENGEQVEYLVGTMIELPRAALTADKIAARGRVLLVRHQRPDADDLWPEPRRRRALPAGLCRAKLLQDDPFQGSTRRAWASWSDGHRARPAHPPELKVGICGEHGGEPAA